MRYMLRVVVALFAVIGFVSSIQQVRGQGAPTFEGRTFTHIGMVVPDLEKTVKSLSEIWGVEAPRITAVPQVAYPPNATGDRNATVKVAQLQLDNLRIELLEPTGGPSPYKAWLDKHGAGINHIAFAVNDIPESIRVLEGKGGTWVMGDATTSYGHVDMPDLGFFIELGRPPAPPN